MEERGGEMTEEECLKARFIMTMHRFQRVRPGLLFQHISKGEFLLLDLIHKKTDGPPSCGVSVSELAAALRLQPPAVSRMLRALDVKGFIGRSVGREDRRNTYVYLTETGAQEREKNVAIFSDFAGTIIRNMGKEEMEQLIALWNRLVDVMEEELSKRKGKEEADV